MSKEEITQLIEQFINEYGLFYRFKNWLEEKGYSLSEIGITEEDY